MFSPKLHESKILFVIVLMIMNVNKYLATLLYKAYGLLLVSTIMNYAVLILLIFYYVQVVTQVRVLYLIDM